VLFNHHMRSETWNTVDLKLILVADLEPIHLLEKTVVSYLADEGTDDY